MATFSAGASIALAGGAVIWQTTDGLQAFTAESARRLAILRSPRLVPDVVLKDSDGESADLRDLARRPTVVEFIYTNCPTICVSLGQDFQRLQAELDNSGLSGRVRLLSICFDLKHDTDRAMTEYAKYHGANPKIWSVVRPDTEDGLRQILETFEIRIVADLDGQFTHNAALHVVDATGHLSNIYDIGDHKPLLNRLRGFL